MSILYFVRHGEKQSGIANPPLTQLGHQQAVKTAAYLRQFPITDIIASPLERTQQTAEHIATALSLPVITDERLKERLEWDPAHTTYEEFLAEWGKTSDDRNFTPRLGDSAKKTGERVTATALTHFRADAHVVLVTHGGTIVDFLNTHFDNHALTKLPKTFPTGFDFVIRECSVTTVKTEGEKFSLVRLHSTDHLD